MRLSGTRNVAGMVWYTSKDCHRECAMLESIKRMRTRGLLASWAVYWLGLALTLAPAAGAVWRATRSGGKGEVSASVGDWVVSLTVKSAGASIWTGSVHMLTLALLIAGPPLALWLLWVALRPRPAEVREPA